MVHDSIVNASIPNATSKDFGKKKRANRSARLKQCKLDARREQWLSQGKNKGSKEELNEENGQKSEGGKRKEKRLEERRVSVGVGVEEEIHCNDSDSEGSVMSPANSPMSNVVGSGNNNNYTGSSSSSSSSSASTSSFGSGGCCSGSITEEEEEGGDDGCLDDWEAVADALVSEGVNQQSVDHDHSSEKAAVEESEAKEGRDVNVDAQGERVKSDSVGILGRAGATTKAWRPDDAFRPQSLPNLSKQRSYPASSERLSGRGMNPWGPTPLPPCVPSSCPICTEDLDLTDSSFQPCPCGFHLCLFCHKRILEEDARCPGCRKPYVSQITVKETSICDASLTIRLGRSSSMFSRV